MNLIEAERLVRQITDVLQNRASEAQARPLAQVYADLCRRVNHRLEQCAAMLGQGDEHQALQLAEVPPPVLELTSRLAFRETSEWREFCRKNDLPLAEALEGKFIRRLNAAYGQGIAADHEIYRAYRQAVLLHNDEQAVKALRSIVWRNPADTNAPRELERLEQKILRARLDELDETLRAGDDSRAAKLVEAIETLDFQTRPDGEAWRHGQAARCRVLLSQARHRRAESRWADAATLLAEVRTLCREHPSQLSANEAQSLSELESWTAACHQEQAEKDRFERALLELRQRLARGEEQQMSGDLPGRSQLREQFDALRHQWREIELADRPVGNELAARTHKLVALFEARLSRLEKRRRILVVAGVTLFTVGALAASLRFWQQRKARDVAAELKSLRDERQVNAAEKRLAQIRSGDSRLAASAAVPAAMAATEAFLGRERLRQQRCDAALSELQALSDHGFTNLAPEQTQARFEAAQRDVEAAAKDFQRDLQRKLTPLVSRWDLWLDARRNELAAGCRRSLEQAGEIAARALRYDRGPEAVRAGLAALEPQLRELPSLIAPPLPRLAPPSDLQNEFKALQQRRQNCAAELEKWDQVQIAWQNPSSVDAYLESLKVFQRSEFAAPAEARAAAEVLAMNVSTSALLAALLLPNQPEAWAQLQSGAALQLQPDEVMPAERTKFRELRDDENIHNVRRLRRTLRDAGPSESNRVRTLFLRGEWENTRSSLKRGMIYDPTDSPAALAFKRQEFISNVQFEELGRAPEADAFETVGLKRLFDNSGTNYTAALLRVLDQINREQGSSSLFRAWLALRLHECLELRPVPWGAPWAPAAATDRQRLRELGAETIRSGDWLVPARQRELGERLENHFQTARAVSYLAQARFLHTLARLTADAGFALAGHVDGNGKAALAAEPREGVELWGWTLNPRGPALLFQRRKGEKRFEVIHPPLPFSPLLVFRGDRRQLVSQSKETLGQQASDTGAYLPPLFAVTHE